MNKKYACFLLILLLLTGCSVYPAYDRNTSRDPAASSPEQDDGRKESGSLDQPPLDGQDMQSPGQDTKTSATGEDAPGTADDTTIPGTYTVPEGWVKAEQYSTASKIFYVEEGHEQDELPDNISINIGTNKYSKENHAQFREAIVRQLLKQLEGIDAELLGDGTYTEQDYVVYIFTINEEDVVTKQYYIVDDYRYCLVHLTNYTGSENADEAAQAIVDSFVWEDAGE